MGLEMSMLACIYDHRKPESMETQHVLGFIGLPAVSKPFGMPNADLSGVTSSLWSRWAKGNDLGREPGNTVNFMNMKGVWNLASLQELIVSNHLFQREVSGMIGLGADDHQIL